MKHLIFLLSLLLVFTACEADKTNTETTNTTEPVATQLEDPFIHSVYFWFKEGVTEAQKEAFYADTEKFREIEVIKAMFTGHPAETYRDVVERSYDYSLILHFEDMAGHDVYQKAPLHLEMIEKHSALWERVMVLDME